MRDVFDKLRGAWASLDRKRGPWFFGTRGKDTFWGSAALLLVVCFIDYLSPYATIIQPYYKHIIYNCLLYALLTLSLNLVSGYIGQLSLGHAAFFGIGAYMTGALVKVAGFNFWLTIPIGMAAAAILAIPLAAAAIRVRGAFLVVITYGFSEVLRFVAINTDILGGSAGIPGIKAPAVFGLPFSRVGPSGKEAYIILAFLLVSGLSFFISRLETSRAGYAFSAIREDEIAALAMGVNIRYYKTLAIVMSAFFCGAAGSLQAGYATFVSPELLSSTQSILILTMVIVGGPRSVKGSILGAALMTVLPEIFRTVKDVFHLGIDPWMILYGFILIVMMRARPQGFWGKSSVVAK